MSTWIPLLGRIFLAAIFLKSGIDKLLNPDLARTLIASTGLPFVDVALWLTVVGLIGGGISILVGWKMRYGAWFLIGFLIPTTLIFHTDFSDRSQEIAFLKNLGLMGGLLMALGSSPGIWSFDGHEGPR
ncbi:MAG: DoxX family protein [Cyanobacteria bacterium P01_H01_bin.15]